MLLLKVRVAGGLKVHLDGGRQKVEAVLCVVDGGALKDSVLKEADRRTKLYEGIEGLSSCRIGDRLIDLVEALGQRGLKYLRGFVVKGDIIAIFSIKDQTSEVLASGNERG